MQRPRGLRVLVAEDHRESAEALALFIREQGHEVAVRPRTALGPPSGSGGAAGRGVPRHPPAGHRTAARSPRTFTGGPAWRRPFLVAPHGAGRRTVPAAARRNRGSTLHVIKPVHPATLFGLLRRFQAFLAGHRGGRSRHLTAARAMRPASSPPSVRSSGSPRRRRFGRRRQCPPNASTQQR